jgi:hypothetical protein
MNRRVPVVCMHQEIDVGEDHRDSFRAASSASSSSTS